jgi:hypothetical protein
MILAARPGGHTFLQRDADSVAAGELLPPHEAGEAVSAIHPSHERGVVTETGKDASLSIEEDCSGPASWK